MTALTEIGCTLAEVGLKERGMEGFNCKTHSKRNLCIAVCNKGNDGMVRYKRSEGKFKY